MSELKLKQSLSHTAPQRIYGRNPFAAGNSLLISGCWAGQMRNYNRREVYGIER